MLLDVLMTLEAEGKPYLAHNQLHCCVKMSGYRQAG